MNPLVPQQVGRVTESLPTDRTGEQLLPRMNKLVTHQVSRVFETVLALGAMKCSLTSVNSLVMRMQVGELCESIPAHRAAERPLPSVSSLVRQEVG